MVRTFGENDKRWSGGIWDAFKQVNGDRYIDMWIILDTNSKSDMGGQLHIKVH